MVVLLVEKPLYAWPGLIIVALGMPVSYGWRSGGQVGSRAGGQ